MAVINDPNTAANITAVGEKASSSTGALHTVQKPLPSSVGHYRYSVRIASTAAQAANSRIFEIRNTHASNILIPTRMSIRILQTAAGTLQENSLDLFKLTAFTAVDTTNTVTPVASTKRTSMSAHAGNGADIRHLTITGVAAGMTGGTLTKDANPLATFPYMVTAGVATATYQPPQWGPYDFFDDVNGTHPLALVQNEGIELENRVLNVTSMNVTWYIDISFAIVAAY
jgi:hypothetical protein